MIGEKRSFEAIPIDRSEMDWRHLFAESAALPCINVTSSSSSTTTTTTTRYVTSHPCQLSLAIPSWVGAMSTSQRAVMPCGWGVKAGMIRVWVAGKTVWSPCYTRAISERFRDKELIIKRYINSPSLLLLYFTTTTTTTRSDVCALELRYDTLRYADLRSKLMSIRLSLPDRCQNERKTNYWCKQKPTNRRRSKNSQRAHKVNPMGEVSSPVPS